jgi:hypothetical protein
MRAATNTILRNLLPNHSVPFLRELVNDISQRSSDIDPRVVCVEFVFGQSDNGNINVAKNNSFSTIICLLYKSYLFL